MYATSGPLVSRVPDDDDVWGHSQSWISGSTWALAFSTIQS